MKIHYPLTLVTFLVVLMGLSPAFASSSMIVHKSPTCGCCEKYVDYLLENDFSVTSVNETDMSAIKKKHGMAGAASCHTGLIGGYVVEGHVPVSAINKLLKEKPDIVGISAPGMPLNSPGMGEMKKGTLTIYAVPKNGATPYVFSVE